MIRAAPESASRDRNDIFLAFSARKQSARRRRRRESRRSCVPALANANAGSTWMGNCCGASFRPLAVRAGRRVESLAEILVSKLFRRQVSQEHSDRTANGSTPKKCTRRWSGSDASVAKKLRSAKGECFDLDTLFDRLNELYFESALSRPRLGWSRALSSSLLGHYDPPITHCPEPGFGFPADAALGGRVRSVPRDASYRFPVELRSGRRHIHTRPFRAAENCSWL